GCPALCVPSRAPGAGSLHALPKGGVPGVRADLGGGEPLPAVPRGGARAGAPSVVLVDLVCLGDRHRRAVPGHRPGAHLGDGPLGQTVGGWGRGQEPGTLDLLDDGVELMTRCWSAVGVLWLLALPARAMLALLLALAARLGEISELAAPTFLPRSYALLLLGIATVYGRLVLLQAYRRAHAGPAPTGWASLRVPPGDLARAVLATLLVFLLLCILSPTVVLPPFLLPALGLASVAAAGAGPGWRRAVPATFAGFARPGRLAAAHGLLLLGWGVATVNLHLLVQLAAEAATQLLGMDPAGLVARLSFHN